MQLAKRLPLIRFWIALAISITVFPFLWHKLIVRWLVVGTLSVEAIGVNMVVGLFVALLVARQRVDYAFPKIVLCMLLWSAWIVIAVLLLKKRVDTRSPMLPVAMALAATNCGVITLAWLFWFEARRVAWSVLGIVFLLPFWILFQPKGMYGDGKSVVDWRSFSTTASLTTPIESTPIANKQAIDYPFLGPNRDAVIPGLRLKSDWSTSPPEVQWRGAIGAGWSGIAVTGKLAVTMEETELGECITAFDFAGEQRWQDSEKNSHFDPPMGGAGPRATPAIDNGRVYAVGPSGLLRCVELATGKRLWSQQIQDPTAPAQQHGVVGSPLIYEELVIVATTNEGGSCLRAYDKASGNHVWSGGEQQGAYSSPFVLHPNPDNQSQRQIGLFAANGIVACDPSDGSMLWQYPWRNVDNTNVAQPIAFTAIDQDGASRTNLIVSSAYGQGSVRLQLRQGMANQTDWNVEKVWTSRRLQTKFTTAVRFDGELIGLSNGILEAIDENNGERIWKSGRFGHGQILKVGTQLLVLSESGELVLLDIQPGQKSVELGRFKLFDNKSWSIPSLVGNLLLARNDREIVCVRLPIQVGVAVDASLPID